MTTYCSSRSTQFPFFLGSVQLIQPTVRTMIQMPKKIYYKVFLIGMIVLCVFLEKNCRCSSTAGYSKRESHGRKETDGVNAKRKHLRKISLGNEKKGDKIVHLHFCIYWNSTLENTMVK